MWKLRCGISLHSSLPANSTAHCFDHYIGSVSKGICTFSFLSLPPQNITFEAIHWLDSHNFTFPLVWRMANTYTSFPHPVICTAETARNKIFSFCLSFPFSVQCKWQRCLPISQASAFSCGLGERQFLLSLVLRRSLLLFLSYLLQTAVQTEQHLAKALEARRGFRRVLTQVS